MARAAFNQAANYAGFVDITGEEKKIQAKTLGLVATPTPAPGVEDSPFMTWGEIEGTPFRLDAPDISASIDDAPQFKIPEVPVREKIAQQISEQVAQRYRNKRKHAMDQIKEMAPYVTHIFGK
jgi:protein DGCR14